MYEYSIDLNREGRKHFAFINLHGLLEDVQNQYEEEGADHIRYHLTPWRLEPLLLLWQQSGTSIDDLLRTLMAEVDNFLSAVHFETDVDLRMVEYAFKIFDMMKSYTSEEQWHGLCLPCVQEGRYPRTLLAACRAWRTICPEDCRKGREFA